MYYLYFNHFKKDETTLVFSILGKQRIFFASKVQVFRAKPALAKNSVLCYGVEARTQTQVRAPLRIFRTGRKKLASKT